MGARSAWEQSSADALGAHDTFEKLIFGERLAVLAESGATLAIGSEGVVIGRVYERGRTLPVNVIDAHSSRSLRSEEHTSQLQALMRISSVVCCSTRTNNSRSYFLPKEI